MSSFEEPNLDDTQPMPDSEWHYVEARTFCDASIEATEQGDDERAADLRKEAGQARRQMSIDLLDELRGRE